MNEIKKKTTFGFTRNMKVELLGDTIYLFV